MARMLSGSKRPRPGRTFRGTAGLPGAGIPTTDGRPDVNQLLREMLAKRGVNFGGRRFGTRPPMTSSGRRPFSSRTGRQRRVAEFTEKMQRRVSRYQGAGKGVRSPKQLQDFLRDQGIV